MSFFFNLLVALWKQTMGFSDIVCIIGWAIIVFSKVYVSKISFAYLLILKSQLFTMLKVQCL